MMPESSSRGSETRPDNSVETDDYFQSRKRSNNGVNSVRVSIKSHDDKPDIRKDFDTSEKISISRNVDSGASIAKLKRGSGELTRESWTKRDSSKRSENRPDNPVETDDYVKSRKKSNNGVNSVRVSIRSNERPKNQEDVEIPKKKSILKEVDSALVLSKLKRGSEELTRESREIKSSAAPAKLKRDNDELTRESWTKRDTKKKSEIRPDYPVETDDYVKSRKKSNNGINSVRVSIKSNERQEIQEDVETPKKRSISREIDVSAALTKLKQGNGELPRESWIKPNSSNFIGDVTEFQEAHFVTGSSYEGSWDSLGMNGVGRYVMPNGTIYEGEIRDGMFHGQGSLYWPKKGRLDVIHYRGELKEYKYTFHDGYVYEENNWNYCKFPDRRFFESIKNGLRPGGRTLKTNRQPTQVLPYGCYDTGDGVYDPKTMRITSYDDYKKVLRLPSKDEYEWIIKNCRKSWSEPTGYRPDLNENWSENPPELPYNIAMSNDSPDSSWQRLTTFVREHEYLDSDSEKDYDQSETPLSPEVCLCGKYLILGETCPCMLIAQTEGYEDSEKSSENLFRKFYENDLIDQFYSTGSYSTGSHSTGSSSIKSSSTGSTSDHEKSKSTSREKLEEIDVIKKPKLSQIEREIPQIDLDFLSNISGDSFGDEASKKTRKRSKSTLKAVEVSEKVEKEQEKVEKEQEKEQKRVEVDKEIWHKSVEDEKLKENENIEKGVVKEQSPEGSREKNEEILDDVVENQVLEKFREKSEEVEKEILQKSDEDEKLKKNENIKKGAVKEQSPEGSREKNEEIMDDVVENQVVEKFREKSEEVEKEILQKSDDDEKLKENENIEKGAVTEQSPKRSREKNEEILNDVVENQDLKKLSGKSGNGNIDQTEDAINDKISPKVTKGSKEHKISELDDFMKEKSLKKSGVHPDEKFEVPKKNQDDKVPNESEKKISKALADYQGEISLEKRDYETVPREKVSVIRELEMANDRRSEMKILPEKIPDQYQDRPSTGSKIVEKKSQLDVSSDKNMKENEKKIRKSLTIEGKMEEKIKSKSVDKKLEDFHPEELKKSLKDGKLTEEKIIIDTNEEMKKIQSQSQLGSIKEKSINDNFAKKESLAISERESKTKNLNVFKDDLLSLDKVHPSLASLVLSEGEKLSKEKDIIEIYKEKPKKPKIESMKSANVWRLSGVNQDYGPKTKIEDLLFHPALTAPRSENIVYVRKPCDFRVCKPTIREDRLTASSCRCRKENPIEIPAKSVHSSGQKNINRKK